MLLPLLLATAATSAIPAEKPFPEPTPAMIEACLYNALDQKLVSETKSGEPAKALWDHLTALETPSYEQTVPEGTWLSREFPLGGCFQRVKNPDGSPAKSGLSCSVWIPRKR
jgi:hypothetical protein